MIHSVGLRSAVARCAGSFARGCATVVTLVFASLTATLAAPPAPGGAPSFGHAAIVQRDGEPSLVVDGKQFFFWGGAFFYERLAPSRWRTAMEQMQRLGANTLDLYVPWNWHEIADGDFDFDGRTNPRRNLREVIRLGRELGFHFIVRPGPVIRNEWRNGGYPAWLLARPEYGMPLHDVLEGRYPATATLQNAHSDDAAAEWLANATHLRYASRWLHAALREFAPVADRVIAVQLDDDQGAYIDNQTYPAPNLVRYLGWLDAQARDVIGPVTPTFINTYDMRVPASSPVWTMGNWYQSDAFTIGEHDRAELDFTTAILRTNRHGPLAQSEFQAGWLSAPEDPAPRPADATNTTLALYELLARGARGIIDFPLHDTLAPFGWEAPFSNALYAWDAALPLDSEPVRASAKAPQDTGADAGSGRYPATYRFGRDVARYGALLAEARPWALTAIAYPASTYPGEPSRGSAAIARFRATLSACVTRGGACEPVDLRFTPSAELQRYRELIVDDPTTAANAQAVLRAYRAAGGNVVSVPSASGLPGVLLVGRDASFLIETNWSSTEKRWAARTVVARGRRIAIPAVHLYARSAQLVPIDLHLHRLDARFDRAATITTACDFAIVPAGITFMAWDCDLRGRIARRPIAVPAATGVIWTTIDIHGVAATIASFLTDRTSIAPLSDGSSLRLAPHASVHPMDGAAPVALGRAAVYRADVFEEGASDVVLQNARAQAVIVPDGGARVPVFRNLGPFSPQTMELMEWNTNVFDATGALRDDVLVQAPASTTDRIGKWTRSYPAGMFNRPYAATISDSAGGATARMRYWAPDVVPSGACFERTISLAPDVARLVVDERLVVAPGQGAERQRLVVLSPLATSASPFAIEPNGVPFSTDTATDLPPASRGIARVTIRPFGGYVTTVSWSPGSVESARWEPHRSNATLRLVLAPGWRRVTYALALVKDVDAARRFVEAEQAWVAANPAPGDGEVAKWYTQSPQKRPSESSCGFESHLPQ